MRRSRATAAVLTVAALALPGSALAATDASTTQAATAAVPETLSASFPTNPFGWTLAPGTNDSAAQSVNVKSNKAWGLRVFTDHANLTQWDGTVYGSASLTNGLDVALDGGTAGAVTESADSTGVSNVVAKSDSEAQAAGDTGTDLSLVFKQKFSYADAPGDYRATITYAADQAF